MGLRALHIVVLQHGYHGTVLDFDYLSSLLRGASDTREGGQKEFVLVEPDVNGGMKTDNGIIRCSERYAAYILQAVEERVNCYSSVEEVTATTATTTTTTTEGDPASSVELHLSFVTHSMGGLITRAALPSLLESLQAKYGSVHCDTFCCVSTPHAGVRHMPSSWRGAMGDWIGRLLRSTGLRDMYLHTPVLTQQLLEESYLAAWRSFNRRVLVAVANDNTVMSYSSCFMVPPEDAELLRPRSKSTTNNTSATAASTEAEGTAPGDATAVFPPSAHSRRGLEEQVRDNARGGYHPGPQLSPLLWPTDIIPEERAIAERIVAAVGPFEVYMTDFRPLVDAPAPLSSVETSRGSPSPPRSRTPTPPPSPPPPSQPAQMPTKVTAVPPTGEVSPADARYGAYTMPHRAIVCKQPCNFPQLFGFVLEFIAERIVGIGGASAGAQSVS